MLRLIRKEAKLRKGIGQPHTFDGMSYLPADNAGYIAFSVKFK